MRISDWSSYVCSSDLSRLRGRSAHRGETHSQKGHCMSHLTDEARAPYRRATDDLNGPDSLEAIVADNPSRRSILGKGLLGLSVIPALVLAGCDDANTVAPLPPPPPPPPPPTRPDNP